MKTLEEWKAYVVPSNSDMVHDILRDWEASLTTDSDGGAEVALDCGVSCPAIDEEMLARAMKKAVEVGLLRRWADTEGYLKNWDGMKAVLQAALGN